MVSFNIIMQYFTFFGAIVACILGILKIIDYYNNHPKLSIQEGNCFYEYLGPNETTFTCSLEVTNIGRKVTFVKRVVAFLSNNKKKTLKMYGSVTTVEKQLEPNTYVKVNFNLKFSKKMPLEKYFVKAQIEATNKVYVHYIPMVHFDEWVKPFHELDDAM